ncbi:DUF2169 domain-containing protein [Agrobacterium genomosp. 3]|uniref:DUF2169 family type VI secretion system accessory protein n=1 Tax=Agrobacterium tomkonis TaxID=1183410 RepID=UPI001B5D5126|nr:DUF2169 domain-containing protein [Agrobacterium sp.]MCA1865030.1 DUF2169 domain-containing protein [Agrobacterium tomkonis]MCA1875755.1 DUF2169 domain-containing protein [Agrobacterium tumefaciens]MCA1891297.1 DUF2169 domain-containing protein [Agrobacterium tomkonis]
MWAVSNNTPFSADGYFIRDRDGKEYWCVAVRGRFRARPDGMTDLLEPQPVRLSPAYRDAEANELLADADFAPFRPAADILVNGSAVAPDEKPIDRIDVTVAVGTMTKQAAVTGEARMVKKKRGWDVAEKERASRVELSWRRSLGGSDLFADDDGAECEANPIGRGWSRHFERAPEGAELVMPQIAAPADVFDPGRPLSQPVGFGAIQPAWTTRRIHAGTYDDAWIKNRSPLLPSDFSENFHQTAPVDQVYSGELRGGEPVRLEGLHPEGGYAFRLPQCILEADTRIAGKTLTHRFRLVQLEITGDERLVDLVWNAHVPCGGRDQDVEVSFLRLRQMAGVVA